MRTLYYLYSLPYPLPSYTLYLVYFLFSLVDSLSFSYFLLAFSLSFLSLSLKFFSLSLCAGVCDTFESGVWEPTINKRNSLRSATEAACLILSIDETVKNPQASTQHTH